MRWFVQWPARPDCWRVAFGKKGMKPAEVVEVLDSAGVKLKPDHPWQAAWTHKPRWTADERKFRDVRGWRRAHSVHIGAGVRVFSFAGTVRRSDKP